MKSVKESLNQINVPSYSCQWLYKIVTSTRHKLEQTVQGWLVVYKNTAISRKVVGKSARANPERYCGWFWVHCSSKKFERMAREAMDVCLRVLKESNKSRFDSYSVRNSVLIMSHITFWDCRVHIFSDNLSRNSCIQKLETYNCHRERWLWNGCWQPGHGSLQMWLLNRSSPVHWISQLMALKIQRFIASRKVNRVK